MVHDDASMTHVKLFFSCTSVVFVIFASQKHWRVDLLRCTIILLGIYKSCFGRLLASGPPLRQPIHLPGSPAVWLVKSLPHLRPGANMALPRCPPERGVRSCKCLGVVERIDRPAFWPCSEHMRATLTAGNGRCQTCCGRERARLVPLRLAQGREEQCPRTAEAPRLQKEPQAARVDQPAPLLL